MKALITTTRIFIAGALSLGGLTFANGPSTGLDDELHPKPQMQEEVEEKWEQSPSEGAIIEDEEFRQEQEEHEAQEQEEREFEREHEENKDRVQAEESTD